MIDNQRFIVRYTARVLQLEEVGYAGHWEDRNALFVFDNPADAMGHAEYLKAEPDIFMMAHAWLMCRYICEGHKIACRPSRKKLEAFRVELEEKISFDTEMIAIDMQDVPYYKELHARQFEAAESQRTINGLNHSLTIANRNLYIALGACVFLALALLVS